jgi:hypothetical protein
LIPDFWIFTGYVLTFHPLPFLPFYGLALWQKGMDEKEGDYREEIRWGKRRNRINRETP